MRAPTLSPGFLPAIVLLIVLGNALVQPGSRFQADGEVLFTQRVGELQARDVQPNQVDEPTGGYGYPPPPPPYGPVTSESSTEDLCECF
jgi:hypothetical protein